MKHPINLSEGHGTILHKIVVLFKLRKLKYLFQMLTTGIIVSKLKVLASEHIFKNTFSRFAL